MLQKQFISADELLIDSFSLASKIYHSSFRPNFIVGLWRGGTPVGIAVQEYFSFKEQETDHIAIRTSAYKNIDQMGPQIRVHGLDYLIAKANAQDSLLLVDDVYDSGFTMQAVLEEFTKKARKNIPHDIRIATVYYKPHRNQTTRIPDYYVHETDRWLVFPHELNGLTPDEIREGKGAEIAKIVAKDR